MKRTELQRLLSKRGVASRSKAAELIKAGKVRVDGKLLRDPTAYVSMSAVVTVDGAQIEESQGRILIAFHKPRGVITTASDEQGRKTVYDVLPENYRGLKAVGRLDMATSGLLLFTNDNGLADYLLDPRNKIPRTYVATVKGCIEEATATRLEQGIMDKGERLQASSVVIRKTSGRESTVIVTLLEGKNREVRRMFLAVGHEVTALKRTQFGQVKLGSLPTGHCVELSADVFD